MRRWALAVLVLLMAAGGAAADIEIHASHHDSEGSGGSKNHYFMTHAIPTTGTSYATIYGYGACLGYETGPTKGAVTSFYHETDLICQEIVRVEHVYTPVLSCDITTTAAAAGVNYDSYMHFIGPYGCCCAYYGNLTTITYDSNYTLSGNIGCINEIDLYIDNDGWLQLIYDHNVSGESEYSYDIGLNGTYKIVFDDTYSFEFTCDGNEVVDYDVCLYVYGYTCGIEHIKLYKDDGGWVLEDTYYQATIGVNPYEMVIESGNDYKLNFSDGHEYLFSCTGDHVLYNWDRCQWAYPPNGDPVPIVIYVGYDNRIVLLQDAHGNFIEHSQVAVYDQTDDVYLQKWTDNPDGYLVLAARFDTDHDVQIAVRTFDSVHTTTTVYPMNGTAENLTWTNWTIPIMYNIQMEPVDTYNVPLFDVFCGLAEYTPINPLSFWGMDFNRGYVPVTNCSGFSRCDIIAEKGGYVPYEVTALNWTSRSAMVKDYRHEIVMVKE